MASMFLPRHYLQTTCELGYTNNIEKIPEPYRINQWEHYMLPCSNDYSMMALCDNPFEIISAIYGMENVQNSVISHLKKYRKYYTTVSAEYLNTKKLYFLNWLSGMMTKKLPADELCLHALATFMNIHITVDYLGGFWTTLSIPHINHDLAIALLDIHLVYRGFCKFYLLCRNTLLKTVGCRLLQHKIMQELPKVTIKLHRIDHCSSTTKPPPNKNVGKMNTSHRDTTDTDSTEIYEQLNTIHDTSDQDSESTIFYELEEKELGKIYFVHEKTKTKDCHNLPTVPHQLYFKCPHTTCKFRSNKRKVTNKHYRLIHKTTSKCIYCRKIYSTPHSLTQHLYLHKQNDKGYLCKKCGKIFPFRSQFLIHNIKHTRKYKEECMECSITFKYRHDMLKHHHEHFAKEYKCEECEFTGTLLKLKSHKKQHDTTIVYECVLCKECFNYRMALWWHNHRCKQSDSPDY